MNPHVKICGITRLEDALTAVEVGASAIGLIFWPGSPRYIDPYRARDIVRGLPPAMAAVGVFVDQPLDYVRAVANLVKLSAIQLHGGEPSAFYRGLQHRVIKAVAIGNGSVEAALSEIPESVTLLLDAHDPVRIGGTGRTIDWGMAAAIAARRRVILSGGLHSANVRQAIERVRPYGVDVASGVESQPGVKDPDRMRAFLASVRQATAHE